jgi:hypothetical protein
MASFDKHLQNTKIFNFLSHHNTFSTQKQKPPSKIVIKRTQYFPPTPKTIPEEFLLARNFYPLTSFPSPKPPIGLAIIFHMCLMMAALSIRQSF